MQKKLYAIHHVFYIFTIFICHWRYGAGTTGVHLDFQYSEPVYYNYPVRTFDYSQFTSISNPCAYLETVVTIFSPVALTLRRQPNQRSRDADHAFLG